MVPPIAGGQQYRNNPCALALYNYYFILEPVDFDVACWPVTKWVKIRRGSVRNIFKFQLRDGKETIVLFGQNRTERQRTGPN